MPPTPDAATRARMEALDPPVTAETVTASGDVGAGLLVAACREGDLPRAWALLEQAAAPPSRAALHMALRWPAHPALVELLIAHGADAAGWRDGNDETALHWVQSAATVRALLAAGCDAGVRDKTGKTALHSTHPSPAALRALVEEGGADAWPRDEGGCLPLHVHAHDAAKAETLLALMLARRPAELHAAAGSSSAVTLAAAVSARGGLVDALRRPPRAATEREQGVLLSVLLASGADACALLACLHTDEQRQLLLAHAAATLPGAPKPAANVLVQHARDSPLFTGRVAAWESERRAAADRERAEAARWLAPGQSTLLLDEKRERRLAALEEDLAAWAWARSAVAAAAANLSAPRTTFAAWLRARDGEGRTALFSALRARDDPARALLLLRYGARIDSEDTLTQLLLHGPAIVRVALTDCGAGSCGFVLDRACAARACAAAAAEYARLDSRARDDCPRPRAAALTEAFEECLPRRVKRISRGLQHAVPLPHRRGYRAPLDIVSEYLGFSLAVGPA